MKNKTCGGCKYFYDYENRCTPCVWCKPTDGACAEFEPQTITNGDRIIAGGMRALAEIFDDLANNCNKCKYCIHQTKDYGCRFDDPHDEYDEGYLDDDDCLNGFEAWLNAPAKEESEVK